MRCVAGEAGQTLRAFGDLRVLELKRGRWHAVCQSSGDAGVDAVELHSIREEPNWSEEEKELFIHKTEDM
jgi:hypothetical protein